MDELRIGLATKFMRSIVAKLISKLVRKKLGYKVDIQLNNVEVKMEDEKIHLHINIDAGLNKDEFVKIIKAIGLE